MLGIWSTFLHVTSVPERGLSRNKRAWARTFFFFFLTIGQDPFLWILLQTLLYIRIAQGDSSGRGSTDTPGWLWLNRAGCEQKVSSCLREPQAVFIIPHFSVAEGLRNYLLFSFSVVSDSALPWIAAHQASLSFTIPRSLLKLMSIKSVMPSNYLILCHPFLLLPSIFPSIRVFSNESGLHIRWPKYWSFSFSISPSNEYSGLISFRIDWLDLLAVQGTLKSLLQHHSSKASILQCSAFFMVQLSHPYMTTGKTVALTTWTFIHC